MRRRILGSIVAVALLAGLTHLPLFAQGEFGEFISGSYLPLVFNPLPPGPTSTPELTPTQAPVFALQNGNFEAGHSGWAEASTNGNTLILNRYPSTLRPHGGAWYAWLGGDYSDTSAVVQRITVPKEKASLVYWRWIASSDICDANGDIGGVALDFGNDNIKVLDAFPLCSPSSTNGWRSRTVDMSAYAGQTADLYILADTDSVLNSNLFIDDVSLNGQRLRSAAAMAVNDPALAAATQTHGARGAKHDSPAVDAVRAALAATH